MGHVTCGCIVLILRSCSACFIVQGLHTNSLKTEVGSKVKSKGIGTANSPKSPEALSADDRNVVRLLMSFIVAANHAS